MSSARERILEAADRLFYGQGIHAVGVEALAAAAGVTKRTLYRHFASKDLLIAAYVRGRLTRPVIFVDDSRPPSEQILRLFTQLGQAFSSGTFRGCAFINAAAELSDRTHPAVHLAAEAKNVRQEWFRVLAERAGARNPDHLAAQLMILVDGTIAGWLVRRDPAIAAIAYSTAVTLLAGAGVASSDTRS